MFVEVVIRNLAHEVAYLLPVDDPEPDKMRALARRISGAAYVLRSELRNASKVFEEYGIEVPDLPRIEY